MTGDRGKEMKTAMRKRMTAALFAAGACLSFAACGAKVSYKDGDYEGKSSTYINDDGSEDGNGYGVVKLTIRDNAITSCTYQTFETDGSLKGAEYGKKSGEVANRDFYNKAQKAVAACDKYAEDLISSGRPEDVDVITGATINYNEFIEAANAALDQAKEK